MDFHSRKSHPYQASRKCSLAFLPQMNKIALRCSFNFMWLWLDSWQNKSKKVGIISSILLKSRKRGLTICLPPDEMIVCNPKVKRIADISIGDKVLTHKGNFHKVKRIYKRKYSGRMFKITPRKFCLPFSVTEEHPVLVGKLSYPDIPKRYVNKRWSKAKLDFLISNFMTMRGKELSVILGKSVKAVQIKAERIQKRCFPDVSVEWLPVNELSLHDFIAYPIVSGINDVDSIFIHDYWMPEANSAWKLEDGMFVLGRGYKTKLLDKVKVSDAFMKFCGYYVADGSSDRASVNIAASCVAEAEEIKELIKASFSLDASSFHYHGCVIVRVSAKPLALFMKNLFGKNVYEKHVPEFFLKLPFEKQKEFLDGYLHGDGCYHEKRKVISFATVSPVLLSGLVQLFLRNGIVPQINRAVSSNSQKRNFIYNCQIYRKMHTVIFSKDYVLFPVKEIEAFHYDGDVCNIEVENDNSYLTLSSCVHNCYTTQGIGQVVKRVRDITDFVAYPIMSPDGRACKVIIMRGGSTRPTPINQPPLYFNTESVYAMYDTREEVQPIEDVDKAVYKEQFLDIYENKTFINDYLVEQLHFNDEDRIRKFCDAIQAAINPDDIRSEKDRKDNKEVMSAI